MLIYSVIYHVKEVQERAWECASKGDVLEENVHHVRRVVETGTASPVDFHLVTLVNQYDGVTDDNRVPTPTNSLSVEDYVVGDVTRGDDP